MVVQLFRNTSRQLVDEMLFFKVSLCPTVVFICGVILLLLAANVQLFIERFSNF